MTSQFHGFFTILFLACFCYLEPLFDANRKRVGPFTMIPLTLERKRMEDEWEDAMSPLFRSSSRHVFTNFPNTNLRIFSTKYLVKFVLISSNDHNWEKNAFLPIRTMLSFWNEKYWWKNSYFIFKKFVKAWRELDNSQYVSIFEAEYDRDYVIQVVAVDGGAGWGEREGRAIVEAKPIFYHSRPFMKYLPPPDPLEEIPEECK